jgi:hypothetical protein
MVEIQIDGKNDIDGGFKLVQNVAETVYETTQWNLAKSKIITGRINGKKG